MDTPKTPAPGTTANPALLIVPPTTPVGHVDLKERLKQAFKAMPHIDALWVTPDENFHLHAHNGGKRYHRKEVTGKDTVGATEAATIVQIQKATTVVEVESLSAGMVSDSIKEAAKDRKKDLEAKPTVDEQAAIDIINKMTNADEVEIALKGEQRVPVIEAGQHKIEQLKGHPGSWTNEANQPKSKQP